MLITNAKPYLDLATIISQINAYASDILPNLIHTENISHFILLSLVFNQCVLERKAYPWMSIAQNPKFSEECECMKKQQKKSF